MQPNCVHHDVGGGTVNRLPSLCSRRQFLRTSIVGGVGALSVLRPCGGPLLATGKPPSRVALTTGADRADNVFRALQSFKREIAASIGRKRVLVKPNMVIGTEGAAGGGNLALSATAVDAVEGVLEFLKSIGKTEVIVAESSATDAAKVGFGNLGYLRLAGKYPVRFLDLDQEGHQVVDVWYGGRAGSSRKPVRVSRLLLDPDLFVISLTRLKTHNCVLYTLSLKNLAMASPCIDLGWRYGQTGCRSDKNTMHGDGRPAYQDLNDNLHLLARRGVTPDLAVFDAYEGMQGQGPIWGAPVPHRVAVASLDWLAADRVGLELMGVTQWDPNLPSKYIPPYLSYCAQSGLGEFDLNRIAVEGERVGDHIVKYDLHSDAANMLGAAATPRS